MRFSSLALMASLKSSRPNISYSLLEEGPQILKSLEAKSTPSTPMISFGGLKILEGP
jgi:hypothetical protein